MNLNAGTGAVNTFTTYTKYIVKHCDEWFSSIEVANSTAGGSNGYVLGGRSNYPVYDPSCTCYPVNNYPYTQWMCKLDPAGNIVWTSLIEPKDAAAFSPSISILPGAEISRVYERYNSNTNAYEYYGVADQFEYPTSPAPIIDTNVVVYKLDDNGSNSLSPNEFHFQPAFNENLTISTTQITGIETGGGPDDGIQIFTNDNPKRLIFTKAYFNGTAGCNDNQVNVDNIYPGPDSISTINVHHTTYTTGCNLGQIMPSFISITIGTICAASSLAAGNNSRIATPTGIEQTDQNVNEVSIFPNPSNGSLTIRFEQINSEKNINLDVIDNLGRKVGSFSFPPSLDLKLDVKNLGLSDGLYNLEIRNGQYFYRQKLVYNSK